MTGRAARGGGFHPFLPPRRARSRHAAGGRKARTHVCRDAEKNRLAARKDGRFMGYAATMVRRRGACRHPNLGRTLVRFLPYPANGRWVVASACARRARRCRTRERAYVDKCQPLENQITSRSAYPSGARDAAAHSNACDDTPHITPRRGARAGTLIRPGDQTSPPRTGGPPPGNPGGWAERREYGTTNGNV